MMCHKEERFLIVFTENDETPEKSKRLAAYAFYKS